MCHKRRRSGILLSQLLAGDPGETAFVSFSGEVRVIQDFTADSDKLTRALRDLRAQGNGVATLESLMQALRMLGHRKAGERKVILMIGESRDRSSKIGISSVVLEGKRQNASIYWLTYSAFLAPFTNKQKTVATVRNPKTAARTRKRMSRYCLRIPVRSDGSLSSRSWRNKTKVDTAAFLSRATGARTIFFLKQATLEEAIAAIGEKVHRQHVLSFQPAPTAAGEFHTIRLEVRRQPELHARTHTGYRAIP